MTNKNNQQNYCMEKIRRNIEAYFQENEPCYEVEAVLTSRKVNIFLVIARRVLFSLPTSRIYACWCWDEEKKTMCDEPECTDSIYKALEICAEYR